MCEGGFKTMKLKAMQRSSPGPYVKILALTFCTILWNEEKGGKCASTFSSELLVHVSRQLALTLEPAVFTPCTARGANARSDFIFCFKTCSSPLCLLWMQLYAPHDCGLLRILLSHICSNSSTGDHLCDLQQCIWTVPALQQRSSKSTNRGGCKWHNPKTIETIFFKVYLFSGPTLTKCTWFIKFFLKCHKR